MSKQTTLILGGRVNYSSPTVEIVEFSTEQGFATSHGEAGSAGTNPGDNDYGDF